MSQGRVQIGDRARVSPTSTEARHFGRREFPPLEQALLAESTKAGSSRSHVADLFEEAADAVEVARRLWDSWEDDAEIRDLPTGRFIDQDKLHYIDFAGRFFSVKGPSITPRSPQGRPVVTALEHARVPYEFAARSAEVVYVTPHSAEEARSIVQEIRGLSSELKIFADVVVFLGEDAARRKAWLDELDGAELQSDAAVFTGTTAELPDLLLDWQRAGIQGYRLRPGALPHDLETISRELTAELRARRVQAGVRIRHLARAAGPAPSGEPLRGGPMKFLTITLIAHTDGRSQTERFREVVDNAVLAEELGFDGFRCSTSPPRTSGTATAKGTSCSAGCGGRTR